MEKECLKGFNPTIYVILSEAKYYSPLTSPPVKRYPSIFFLCQLYSILIAQGASFGPFEGKVYDLDDYDLSKGYTTGVYKYDMVGTVKLSSLSVKKNQPGRTVLSRCFYARSLWNHLHVTTHRDQGRLL